MLYVAELTSKERGTVWKEFGEYHKMLHKCLLVEATHTGVVRPAHQDEIEDRIAKLEARRDEYRRRYIDEGWGNLVALNEIEAACGAEIVMLRAHLREEGSLPGIELPK